MVKKIEDVAFFDDINEAFTYQNNCGGALFTNTKDSNTVDTYNFFADYSTANGLKGLSAFPYCVANKSICDWWGIETEE